MSPPFILATIYAVFFALINPLSAYPHGKTIHVSSGQSIQAAIDSAHGGDKIVVDAGTYAEQLTISTDGITLVGNNAIIVPPSAAAANTCSDLAGPSTQAGICVIGSNVVLQDLANFDGEHRKVKSVGQRVKDTYIKGFTVNGFTGLNIAVVGAQDAIVTENSVSSGTRYGILTVGSKNSNIKHNTVLAVPGPDPFKPLYFIGICMDDVSTVTIAHNDISGYFIGLCVQTDGADIYDNKVHDICVGAYVDPGINGAKLHDNEFSSILPWCPPSFSSGITISGGTNTVVKSNKFSGIKNDGQAAGVVIVDDATGVVASGNDVEKNVFTDNDLDVFEQTTGKGNVVKKNQCTLSNPATLCQ